MATNGGEQSGSADSLTAQVNASGDGGVSLADQTLAGTHDGADPGRSTEDAVLAAGATVGRYLILGKLGAGAMGVVYRAHDPELDRTVALKLLRPREELDKVRAGHRKLLAEAQALARINHPNVVSVFDVGAHLGLVFVAMELVEGETLTAWLAAAPRQWPEILDVMVQAGRGLVAVHAADLLHRDFKPDNVMIGHDGRVRVMDFGLARAATARRFGDGSGDAHATDTLPVGAFVGTPVYSAPEQLLGRRGTPCADEFSYCVTLWEALYGRRPFAADSIPALISQVVDGALTEPRTGARVPGWLRRIVVRGLAYEVDRRFASMAAVLEAIASGRSSARRRRVVLAAAAVASVGVAVVGGLEYAARRRHAACVGAGETIAEVWNDARAVEVRDALVATGVGHAEVTAQRVIPWLDEHAQAWRAARTDACTLADDGVWDGDTLDRALWCLDERRIELAALVTTLAGGEVGSVNAAVPAAAGLGRLEPCTDAFSLLRRPAPPTEERGAIVAVRDELLHAAALQEIGAYDRGLTLANAAVEAAGALSWSPLLAEARLRVGRLLERSGDYAGAEQALEQAYFDAGRADAIEVAAAAASALVSLVGDRLARHTDGLRWSGHHELMMLRMPDPTGLHAATHDEGLAAVRAAMGDHAEARRLYEHGIALREKVMGPDHPQVLDARGNLATVLHDMGEYEAARAINVEGLAARERVLGPGHPDVGKSLNNLALNHRAMGHDDEARVLYERALALWEVSLGPEHPHVAQVLNNLANLSWAGGDHVRATALHERALEIRRRALGPTHPSVGQSLSNLASLHELTGDSAGARDLFAQALAIEERALGPDHPDVARSLGNLGNVYLRADDLESAEPLMRRALAIRERALGPDHPLVAHSLQNLATVLVARGALDEAQALLDRALRIWDAGSGGDEAARPFALIDLAEIAGQRGRRDEALRLAEEALEIATRTAATDVSVAYAEFAVARFVDDPPRARRLAEHALGVYRAHGDTSRGDMVQAWLADAAD